MPMYELAIISIFGSYCASNPPLTSMFIAGCIQRNLINSVMKFIAIGCLHPPYVGRRSIHIYKLV